MSTHHVRFWSEGLQCAATLYLPDATTAPRRFPAVVMAHGFASVKEMNLPDFARIFTRGGIAALAIDYRSLGESDGLPRQTIDPHAQRLDIRNALTWLETRADIDPDRLGLWGTSLGGGQVLQAAAFDSRVKAVVAQVPAVSPLRSAATTLPDDTRAFLARQLTEERRRLARGEPPTYIPITAPADEFSALGPHDLAWHLETKARTPTFENSITLASLELLMQSDPMSFVAAIRPRPLLFIVARQDRTASPELARAAYDLAGEPKELLEFDGGHYDVYDDPETFAFAAHAARAWFQTHLTLPVPA